MDTADIVAKGFGSINRNGKRDVFIADFAKDSRGRDVLFVYKMFSLACVIVI
jgi:hypothetical protein